MTLSIKQAGTGGIAPHSKKTISEKSKTDLLKLLAAKSEKYKNASQTLYYHPLHNPFISETSVLDKTTNIIEDTDHNDIPVKLKNRIIELVTHFSNRQPSYDFNEEGAYQYTMQHLNQEPIPPDADTQDIKYYALEASAMASDLRTEYIMNELTAYSKNYILYFQHKGFVNKIPWSDMKAILDEAINYLKQDSPIFMENIGYADSIWESTLKNTQGYDETKFKAHKGSANIRSFETQIMTDNGKLFSLIKHPTPEQKQEIYNKFGFYAHSKNYGIGSFGYVQMARDLESNELVAVKIFNKSMANKDAEDELKEMSQINGGKHLIRAYGKAQTKDEKGNEKVYLFMDFAGNMNGRQLIAELNKLAKIDSSKANLYTKKFCKQYVESVAELHKKGLYHHDIKPDNFVHGNDSTTLVDYGFVSQNRAQLSCGTIPYFPPESSKGKYNSAKHDSFSLGLVLLGMKLKAEPSFIKNVQLNINGKNVNLRFNKDNHRCHGISGFKPEIIKGHTLDDVIALSLLRDAKDRLTPEQLLKQPYFSEMNN